MVRAVDTKLWNRPCKSSASNVAGRPTVKVIDVARLASFHVRSLATTEDGSMARGGAHTTGPIVTQPSAAASCRDPVSIGRHCARSKAARSWRVLENQRHDPPHPPASSCQGRDSGCQEMWHARRGVTCRPMPCSAVLFKAVSGLRGAPCFLSSSDGQ